MREDHLDAVRASFEIQAAKFEDRSLNFSREEFLTAMRGLVSPEREDHVLEVAAGTAICGRALAPQVETVVCLDATLPMLQTGQAQAEKEGLRNLIFVRGLAEDLPFLDRSFDIVLSRLAFHHFPDIAGAFEEMRRVLKPGGKLVLIDMEAAPEGLRETKDAIEAQRDPSHVKFLTRDEMLKLYEDRGLKVERCETIEMPQRLEKWLELAGTPDPTREDIRRRMTSEMEGGEATGFYPYLREGEILFDQRWVLVLGRKA